MLVRGPSLASVDVVLPDPADRRRSPNITVRTCTEVVERARRRPPGAAHAARRRHRRHRTRRRAVAVRLHRRGAADRLAGRRGAARRARLRPRRPRPDRRRASRRRAGRWTGRRTTWRPASPACSWPATSAPSRPSGSRPPSARARWPSCSCTATWRSCDAHDRSQRSPAAVQPDELRTLFLFEKLTAEQLGLAVPRGPRRDDRARPGLHRGRPGHLLLRAARGHARAARAGSAATTSRSTGPPSAASTRAPSRPTWATGCRRSTTARCGSPSRRGSSCCDADDFAELMQRVVPDGGAPAGGAVLRHQEHPAGRSASGSGCWRSARCRPA